VEEIDLEKYNFQNFRNSVALFLTLDGGRSHTGAHIWSSLPIHQIRPKSEKHFVDRQTDVHTDGRMDLTSNLLGHRWAMT